MSRNEATTVAIKKQEQGSSVKNWKLWIAGWLPAVIGLVFWVVAAFIPEGEYLGVKVLGLLTSLAISVIVHELAHFVVAQLLDLKPWCLSIGYNDVVFDKQFNKFRLTLRAFPYSGAVYPFLFPEELQPRRWREFAMVSAGPLSNALLLGVFALVASRSAESLSFTAVPVQMVLANGYLLLWCLIPYRAIIDGARVPNDGLHLIHLILGRAPIIWRHEHSHKSTETNSSGLSWTWTVKQVSSEALLTQCRRQLRDTNLSLDERCHVLDTFATCVLMYGANEFLPEADQYSEELFQAKPDEWTVKGTRGSILIEKGEIEEGSAMLKDVIQYDPSTFDRAIAASFLALAELKQNNREAAVQWLRASRDFDPHCASMHRIQALLGKKDSPSASPS